MALLDEEEEMDDAELFYLAKQRLARSTKTVPFSEMMSRFGITAEDLDGEDVDIEVEPILL
jgi:hypothetical protein